jgi:hypothetical protein
MWFSNFAVLFVLIVAVTLTPSCAIDEEAKALCVKEMKFLGEDAGWDDVDDCGRSYTSLKEDDIGDYLCFEVCVDMYEDDPDRADLAECRSDCKSDAAKGDSDDDSGDAEDSGDADEERRLEIINECNLSTCTSNRGTDAWASCLAACCRSKGMTNDCRS